MPTPLMGKQFYARTRKEEDTMSFELRITFTGLCAFVFDHPLKGSGLAPTKATILMPNVLKGMLISGPRNVPSFRASHYPQLIYPHWTAAPNSPFDLLGSDGRALLFLWEEHLEILPDGKPQKGKLTLSRKEPHNFRHPHPDEIPSLWWMVAVTDAFPFSSGRIDSMHLDYSPSANGSIISRLEISQGTLSTAELSPFPLQFLPPASGDFNRRIAASLVLSMRAEKYVDVDLPTRKSKLRLQPRGTDPLEIKINNIEIEDFIAPPPRVPQELDRSIDFGIYFDLAGLDTDAQLVRSGGLQSIVHGVCPPAAYAS